MSKHVNIKTDGKHDKHLAKKLTMRYDFEELKQIRTFDDWVEGALKKIAPKNVTVELDFEDWDCTEPGEREGFLKEMLEDVKDAKKRDNFIKEFCAKAESVKLAMKHATDKAQHAGDDVATK
mmetsp:Transcript_51715/g.105272  ORF Transcript_51715/g.105272 Transcript_51715/m.105272 type:complete len:122 (-) Transcript_51715:208-573(-)